MACHSTATRVYYINHISILSASAGAPIQMTAPLCTLSAHSRIIHSSHGRARARGEYRSDKHLTVIVACHFRWTAAASFRPPPLTLSPAKSRTVQTVRMVRATYFSISLATVAALAAVATHRHIWPFRCAAIAMRPMSAPILATEAMAIAAIFASASIISFLFIFAMVGVWLSLGLHFSTDSPRSVRVCVVCN